MRKTHKVKKAIKLMTEGVINQSVDPFPQAKTQLIENPKQEKKSWVNLGKIKKQSGACVRLWTTPKKPTKRAKNWMLQC